MHCGHRLLPFALGLLAFAVPLGTGCLDVRDFEGAWSGERVGEHEALRQGFADRADATLVVESVDLRSLSARLTIEGLFQEALVAPIPGAEADVLTTMSFDGSPARVFLSFVETIDGGGDAMVMVAMYDDPRVVLRVLRGGAMPLYGIFALARGSDGNLSTVGARATIGSSR